MIEQDQPAFISRLSAADIEARERLAGDGALAGIRFAVKDNIDVAGLPTTAACPALDTPATTDATVVARLQAAGAVPVGKTNMDQFATGLVGTRSPYGACHCVADPRYVSGGSSSGSAVAVAAGMVPLALGTDTAGSGRVPAAFNGLVGVKPTRGIVSTLGVLPACRSLDCVTTMTRTVGEARAAFDVIAAYDPQDPYSRRRPPSLPSGVARRFRTVAVPADLAMDEAQRSAWERAVGSAKALGIRLIEVDIAPLLGAAQLLYAGPWVTERYAAVGRYLEPDGPHLDPSVRAIIMGGKDLSAADGFRAFDRLAELRRASAGIWAAADALLLPVTPGHPTLAEVAADPLGVNARLGTYTNFVNLLDLCAVAIPAGQRADGLAFGVQLIAPAFADEPLLDLAAMWCGEHTVAVEPPAGWAAVVAVGAHMSGLPLNHLLVGRGGRLLQRARTAAGYRLQRVPGDGVPRPALVAGEGPPAGFAVEIWELPLAGLGALASEISEPLRLGPLRLSDGTVLTGYLGDAPVLSEAVDISSYDGWRDYITTT